MLALLSFRRGPWVTGLVLSAAMPAWGAPVAVQDRAVDMVALAGGEQILGMFAAPPSEGKAPDGVGRESEATIYVQRVWLKKRQPGFYRKLVKDEKLRRREALEQYRERLGAWQKRRPEPKLLADFIQRSVRDVESRLAAGEKLDEQAGASQLVIVQVPAKQVRRFRVQPPARRRLLALAWQARLEGVEDLAAGELPERLKQQGVDVEHGEADLSDRFDIVPLTPPQWAAKVALIEYEILGKPRYQGTGGTLLEDDGQDAKPPLANLIGDLLQDQLGDALGDLLNPQAGNRPGGDSKRQAAYDKALASAAEKNATGVRLTYLDQELVKRRVTVTDSFHARMPDGGWQAIWRTSATVSTDDVEDQNAEALAADPQVAEIMNTLKGLGLDANQDLFKTALRFGGATQKATRDTEREFAAFLRGHTRRLLGPPVPAPEENR